MTSTVEITKKWAVALVAFLAVFGLFAAAAVEKAAATEVQPVGATVNAVNSTPADFIPRNAYFPVGTVCNDVKAAFSIDNTWDRHQNQNGVGTFSDDNGSVIVDMNANDEGEKAPIFQECFVALWDEDDPGARPVPFGTVSSVDTTDDNGAWTISATAVTANDSIVAIGVPKEGAVINVTSPVPCTITVSSSQASSVFGSYTNGTVQSPASTFAVDGQIDFNPGACAAIGIDTPAQFQGDFTVTAEPPFNNVPVTINP